MYQRRYRKKATEKIDKILIIRFSSIGDIVLTTPVLRGIKKQLPHVKIHFLVKEKFASVISANPHIDKIHLFSNDLSSVIKELQYEKFTHILDLHHNLRSLKVKNDLEAKSFSFPKLNIRKWLLVNLKWNTMPDISIVERYFETTKKIGVHNDGHGLDYFVPEENKTKTRDIPMSHWVGYIACVIGGSYATKKYPVEKWIEFCKVCKFPIILLGGKEDFEAAQQISTAINDIRVYNACGKFNLNESADLVSKARVVITNDTGLMHIAAAFKKPIISLWGNTVPEFGMFPYYGANNLNHIVEPRSIIMEVPGLSCRPCSKIGYNKCPRKHFKCMQLIDTNELLLNAEKLWYGEIASN